MSLLGKAILMSDQQKQPYRLSDFQVLTFDCYGTLIDWETGILAALQPLITRTASNLAPDQILETFARHELAQETETPAMIYSQLLAVVHSQIGKEWGIKTTPAEDAQFGASVKDWPAFEDSPAALQYLKQYYKLVILSNVDRESFKGSNKRLKVEFDSIFTAQDIGSYKPSLANFEYMLSKMEYAGYHKENILHTAESLLHDHLPANKVGIASAWIYRRHAKEGFGATSKPKEVPHYDFRFTSLVEMVDAHRRSFLHPRR
jgi:2-haloacid dehalogenase